MWKRRQAMMRGREEEALGKGKEEEEEEEEKRGEEGCCSVCCNNAEDPEEKGRDEKFCNCSCNEDEHPEEASCACRNEEEAEEEEEEEEKNPKKAEEKEEEARSGCRNAEGEVFLPCYSEEEGMKNKNGRPAQRREVREGTEESTQKGGETAIAPATADQLSSPEECSERRDADVGKSASPAATSAAAGNFFAWKSKVRRYSITADAASGQTAGEASPAEAAPEASPKAAAAASAAAAARQKEGAARKRAPPASSSTRALSQTAAAGMELAGGSQSTAAAAASTAAAGEAQAVIRTAGAARQTGTRCSIAATTSEGEAAASADQTAAPSRAAATVDIAAAGETASTVAAAAMTPPPPPAAPASRRAAGDGTALTRTETAATTAAARGVYGEGYYVSGGGLRSRVPQASRATTATRGMESSAIAAASTECKLLTQQHGEKQENDGLKGEKKEEEEDRKQNTGEEGKVDRRVVGWKRGKYRQVADHLQRVSRVSFNNVWHSTYAKAHLLIQLSEETYRTYIQGRCYLNFDSGKRLSGRGFFYVLLFFLLLLLALVLLLGTLQHQHKLYRLRPRQILLLQQKTQEQMQKRIQQQQRQQQENANQHFSRMLYNVSIPSLIRPCPSYQKLGAKAYSGNIGAVCLSNEENCESDNEEFSLSSKQLCPRAQGIDALSIFSSTTAAGEERWKRRKSSPFCSQSKKSIAPLRRGYPGGMRKTAYSATSTWRGFDILDNCCIPVSSSFHKSRTRNAADIATSTVFADEQLPPAPTPYFSAVAAGGKTGNNIVSLAAGSQQVSFPKNVFFFSLHRHPPPLSFMDPASPVLVCAEAEEMQLLQRLLRQILSPFHIVSDITVTMLQHMRQRVSSVYERSTQWHSQQHHQQQQRQQQQQQQQDARQLYVDHVHEPLQQRHQQHCPEHETSQQQQSRQEVYQQQDSSQQQKQSAQQPCCGEKGSVEREKTQGENPEERLSNVAGRQESAASASRTVKSCSAGGDDCTNNACTKETTIAAEDEGGATAATIQYEQEVTRYIHDINWEMQIVRMLEDGRRSCFSEVGPAKKLIKPSTKAEDGSANGVPNYVEIAASHVLGGSEEEPRYQLYAQTLRACFNGLLSEYNRRRFATISREAAILLDKYLDGGIPISATSPVGRKSSASYAEQQAQNDSLSLLLPPMSPTLLKAGASTVGAAAGSHAANNFQISAAMRAAAGKRAGAAGSSRDGTANIRGVAADDGVAAVLLSSAAAAASNSASALAVPVTTASSTSATAQSSFSPTIKSSHPITSRTSFSSFSSGVLLTRVSSLLPSDISLYFSFSSYMSPCYPFSRFLHRRLVGWGGLQLHLLLFGGWLHSLFAAEPLTLVHAPRAAFLFILAVYRGLILYEAFNSIEAHFFNKAHRSQRQEHVRTAAASAGAADGSLANASQSAENGSQYDTLEEKLEDLIFFANEKEEQERWYVPQGQHLPQNAQSRSSTDRQANVSRGSRGRSGSSCGKGNNDSECEAESSMDDDSEKLNDKEDDQEHLYRNARGKEWFEEKKNRSNKTPSPDSDFIAAAAWTDFSDHVVLYVLVVIIAAMEISAARSSHTRPRCTASTKSHSNSNSTICNNSNSSSLAAPINSTESNCSTSRQSSSSSIQVTYRETGASPSTSEERSRCGGDYFPSVSSFLTPVSEHGYDGTAEKLGEEEQGKAFKPFLSPSAAVDQSHSLLSDAAAAVRKKVNSETEQFLPACNTDNSNSTEASVRYFSGTNKLYLVVWVYYGFLLVCCFHMAFYTASFFHTPQEIWSGLGVGLLFLVLPLVIICEVLERPTLQRLGIGSGERRVGTRAADATEVVHGCTEASVSGNGEPTGSSKRFASMEANAPASLKDVEEDQDDEEDEEEDDEEGIGFKEDDRLSISSSLSVHSRSSSSSSNCSRPRERPLTATTTRLLPPYRRRPRLFNSSDSNSSYEGTSPLSTFVSRQQKQQQLAFRTASYMTRTRGSHTRHREDTSSSRQVRRSRKRCCDNSFKNTAAAATSEHAVPRYEYYRAGGHPLLQQHEDTIAIR